MVLLALPLYHVHVVLLPAAAVLAAACWQRSSAVALTFEANCLVVVRAGIQQC
jgi:hypothetical protein